MTLPLIYALNNASNSDRKHIRGLVKNHSNKNKRVREVIDFVKRSGGIEYTKAKMEEYYKGALDIMDEFDDSPYKESLSNLVTYTIQRTK